MTQSTYIGDGVYAVQEGGAQVILIVPAGASPNGEEQRIAIDYYTGQLLTNYLERVFGFIKSESDK